MRALVDERPFGELAAGHTHFALLLLTKPTAKERTAIEAMSNVRDHVLVRERDVHWLIRAKSTSSNAFEVPSVRAARSSDR